MDNVSHHHHHGDDHHHMHLEAGSNTPASKEEAEVLLHYMVHHNASHLAELEDLGEYFHSCGMEELHILLHKAADFYAEGNQNLDQALSRLHGE